MNNETKHALHWNWCRFGDGVWVFGHVYVADKIAVFPSSGFDSTAEAVDAAIVKMRLRMAEKLRCEPEQIALIRCDQYDVCKEEKKNTP